jgi:hypothetical protein
MANDETRSLASLALPVSEDMKARGERFALRAKEIVLQTMPEHVVMGLHVDDLAMFRVAQVTVVVKHERYPVYQLKQFVFDYGQIAIVSPT